MSLIQVNDLITIAKMSGTPYLIVEGVDDIPIYDKIKNLNSLDIEIYASKQLDGIEPGCKGVERAIDILNATFTEGLATKYVLGVMDKDVKDFRNEIRSLQNIIYTPYYSMETHLVSNQIVLKIISNFIRSPEALIDRLIVEKFFIFFQEKSFDLYKISLDALKNSTQRNYPNIYSYSDSYQELKNKRKLELLNEINIPLGEFESSLNLNHSIEALKKICKGKWFLSFFCEILALYINTELKNCNCDSERSPCSMCIIQNNTECLYKIKSDLAVNKDTIRTTLVAMSEHGDFSFLIQRIHENLFAA